MISDVSKFGPAAIPPAATTAAAGTVGGSSPAPSSPPVEGKTVQGAGDAVSTEQLQKAAGEANVFLQSIQRNLEFSVDKDSGATVVKVVDKDSGKVVQQMPTAEALSMFKQLKEMDSKMGFLFKNSA